MSTTEGEVTVEVARHVVVADLLVQVKVEIAARFVQIGELLLEAQRGGHAGLLGYPSFDAYVEDKLQMKARKSHYLISCFKRLIEELHVPREKLAEIGWSRAKEILPVVTEQNKAEWIAAAETNTTSDLNLMVRQSQAPPGAAVAMEPYSTLGIGVWKSEREVIEEALEFAKLESQTERTGLALLHICEDYIQEARARREHAMQQTEGPDGPA